jgi:hypothetical protein
LRGGIAIKQRVSYIYRKGESDELPKNTCSNTTGHWV